MKSDPARNFVGLPPKRINWRYSCCKNWNSARRAFDPDERLNPGKILPGEGDHDPGPAQLGGMRVRPDVEGAWI